MSDVQQKVKALNTILFPPHIPNRTVAIEKTCSLCRFTINRIAMAKKPHVDTRMAKYVERRVLELKPTKSQAEIAAQSCQ